MTITELLRKRALAVHEKRAHDDFLDEILDGKPVMIVETPSLRRALRRRRLERALEEMTDPPVVVPRR